ncbi:MAG TPA: hypothetical protein VJ001_02185 [Rhodocyclaceae bacterium]|nr:hypothetical protein [Rhodocyclaceae bacterium]
MNPFLLFRALLPANPLQVGRVLSHTATNESLIELPQGGNCLVRGTSVPTGRMAFIQAGQVQGEAPDVSIIEVTI